MEWDVPKLKEIFDEDTVVLVLSVTLPSSLVVDKVFCVKDSKGKFSVKFSFTASQEGL